MPAIYGRMAVSPRDWHLPALLVLFIAARLCAWAAGVAPPTQHPDHWQFQNPQILHDDLVAGLWYLHSQPPLWNLIYGLSLKFFDSAVLLYATAIASNLLSTMLIYRLITRLSGACGVAFVAAAIFAVMPAALLYENFPLPTSFVAAMVLLATWCATELNGPQRSAAFLGFVLAMWALTMSRATFHIAMVPLACALACLPWRGAWMRRFLPLLVASVSLPLMVYVKNWVLFDTFAASSWGPMNAARMVTVDVPRPALLDAVQRGKCDSIVEAGAFAWTETYRPYVKDDAKFIAVSQRLESARSYLRDYNSLEILTAANRFSKAVPCIIAASPGIYLENVRRAVGIFLSASHHYIYLGSGEDGPPAGGDNVERLRPYIDMFDRVLWLPIGSGPLKSNAPSLVVVLVVAVWLTAWLFARGWMSWRTEEDALRSGAFVLGSLFFAVELATCLVEVLENNRFRHEVEPLMFVFAAVAVAMGARHLAPLRPQPKALKVM
ncbi:MAG: hypothetical protein JO055_08450 [Alphaproteobacteria bacterium]|nr:hypothetical protein [Alphaproteobacteria bacterium]